MLLLPFVGLPLEARQRVVRLEVDPSGGESLPGAAVALLIRDFPALRRVHIGQLSDDDQPSGQLLLDALAGQPHLEELHIPPCSALASIDCLAGTLRHLTLHELQGSPLLNTVMAGGIARLHRLRSLSVGLGCRDGPFLREFLRAAPAELQLLELPRCKCLNWVSPCDAVLHLVKGRVLSLLAPGCLLSGLARFAAEVLLPSGAVAPRLQRLCLQPALLHRVHWAGGTLEGAHADGLRELLRRCDAPEVGSLAVSRSTPLELVVQALQLLQLLRVDVLLHLHMLRSCFNNDVNVAYITLSMRASPGQMPAQSLGAAPHQAPSQPPIVDLMIERFTLGPAMPARDVSTAAAAGALVTPSDAADATRLLPLGGAEQPSAPTAAAAAACTAAGVVCTDEGADDGDGGRDSEVAGGGSGGSGVGESSSAMSTDPPVLLLRGPIVAEVVTDKEALKAWLGRLVAAANCALVAASTLPVAAEAEEAATASVEETYVVQYFSHVALSSRSAVLLFRA